MYKDTVTVFNFYESKTTGDALWYPHVLTGVDLNTDRGFIMKKYGQDSADKAQLHVSYTDVSGQRVVDGLPYLTPKEWKAQTNDLLAGTLTFGATDFFYLGEWSDGTVNEDAYKDGFYAYMNRTYDHVFMITSVGEYSVIPHFEILGR